jgi:hypothetical protein
MGAAIAVAIIGSLAFIVWLILRAIRAKSIKAHIVCYGISLLAAVFTYAYFLSLDVHHIIKVVISIVLGVVLIFIAARHQSRARQA